MRAVKFDANGIASHAGSAEFNIAAEFMPVEPGTYFFPATSQTVAVKEVDGKLVKEPAVEFVYDGPGDRPFTRIAG